jgi:hypothetical protein
MERIERSSVAYHATALPLSYIGLEPEGVVETPTSALRMRCSFLDGAQRTRAACAPPLELLRRKRNWSECGESNSVSRTGDPMPSQWATPAEILERTEIIEISSLGWRPRAHPIYHARSSSLLRSLFGCQRAVLRHTSTVSLLGRSELDKLAQNTDKTKKAGGHFWWPPAS